MNGKSLSRCSDKRRDGTEAGTKALRIGCDDAVASSVRKFPSQQVFDDSPKSREREKIDISIPLSRCDAASYGQRREDGTKKPVRRVLVWSIKPLFNLSI